MNAQTWQLLAIGLIAGVAGGMFGIGGGAIMVPAMVLWMGLDHKFATGTSLGAQVLPVALLGALVYHREGNLNVKFAALIAAGLAIGFLFGALIAAPIDKEIMKKMYGIFMIAVGLRYLLWK